MTKQEITVEIDRSSIKAVRMLPFWIGLAAAMTTVILSKLGILPF